MSLRNLMFSSVAVVGVAVAASLGFAGLHSGAPSVAQESGAALRAVPQSQAAVQLSFAPIVQAASPSVVNVYATRIEQQLASPFASDPFFSRFFGQNFFETRPRESQSLGSGVIVGEGGVILTNVHVIKGATDVRISLSDGREFAVDVVVQDEQTDLAVLKVGDTAGVEFPALEFADSDDLLVGDLVLAIGNPFGVGQTVTSGIVSGLARTGVDVSDYEFFIQTDAAINPGNSGGALVDMDGRLVGINTAIYTRSGGSVGIGFAIPANMARVVADAGAVGGEIIRPWFGAKLQKVTADIAQSLAMDTPYGAMITETAPNGPAARADFRPGDVILSIDGLRVEDPAAFNFRLATRPLGETVQLERLRGGVNETVNFLVESAPQTDANSVATIDANSRFSGITVRQLDPALAEAKGLVYDAQGIMVTEVVRGSPADAMGLQVDDIILELNEVQMTDAASFAQMASQRTRTWQIILQRDGRVSRFIVSG